MNLPAVLTINNYHYPRGGSDRYFLQLAAMLEKEGHRVATFAAHHSQTAHGELLAVSPPRGVDTDRAGNISNLLRYVFSSDARQRMTEAITAFRPDIAHLHIYYGQLTASILKPIRSAGIPVVQTLHEYKLVCPTHGLYALGAFCDACKGRHYWHAPLKRCNRGSLARSGLSMLEAYVSEALGSKELVDRFIAVSDYQKRQLVRLGIPEKKLCVGCVLPVRRARGEGQGTRDAASSLFDDGKRASGVEDRRIGAGYGVLACP
jgi:glycosyltransferase involved in cell wall biosynthesis